MDPIRLWDPRKTVRATGHIPTRGLEPGTQQGGLSTHLKRVIHQIAVDFCSRLALAWGLGEMPR